MLLVRSSDRGPCIPLIISSTPQRQHVVTCRVVSLWQVAPIDDDHGCLCVGELLLDDSDLSPKAAHPVADVTCPGPLTMLPRSQQRKGQTKSRRAYQLSLRVFPLSILHWPLVPIHRNLFLRRPVSQDPLRRRF
jgi:hypothetical protein